MDIQYQLTEDRLTVMMPREVDHHAARHMSTEVDCLIDSWHVRTLVFDFAGTEFMDSSGIGVLNGRKKTMDLHGGSVQAIHLSGRSMQIFDKSGLKTIFELEQQHKKNTLMHTH